MDFLNKAKEVAEKHAGGKSGKKYNGSIFIKALDAVEKYQVKEKAIEYAQKQVAKRKEERLQAGSKAKKEKSIVNKAKEAAEDFLAKQGDKLEKAKSRRSSYSSNGYSNAVNHRGAQSSGRDDAHYKTCQAYWSQQGNVHTGGHLNSSGDSYYASTNSHHASFDTLSHAPHVHASDGGAKQHLNYAGALRRCGFPSGRENDHYLSYEEYYRTTGCDGRSSGYGTRMPGNSSQPGMQYGSYA